MTSRLRRPAALLAAAALALSLLSTACSSTSTPTAQAPAKKSAAPLTPEQQKLNVASFDQVWTTIKDKHFDPNLNGADWTAARTELRPKVESATTMDDARDAIEDLIHRLKQTHFGLIPASAYDDNQTSTDTSDPASPAKPEKKDGYLGLDIRSIDNKAIVTRVDPDSPAAAAGVKTGWELVSVGPRAVRPVFANAAANPIHVGLPTPTLQALVAHQLLAAPIGATRALGFLDDSDRAIVLPVTAAAPRGTSITFSNLPTMHLALERKLLPGNIGYVSMSIWLAPDQTIKFIEESVKEFKSADGLIIDIRGNPGGLGGIAPAVAGYLVADKNKELGTLITRQFKQKFLVNPRTPNFTGPVVILVDELSMSTSEIFAAGLKDIGRAQIIGTHTPGAALPSVIVNLPNGDRFQYAFANYLSFSGQPLEGKGVTPDQEVPLDRKSLLAGTDNQIQIAITWIKATRASAASTNTTTYLAHAN